jgi:hypothetical protein
MININVSEGMISGSYGKEQFVVTFTKERYDAMKALKVRADAATSVDELKMVYGEFSSLTKEDYKKVIETKCPWLVVNPMTEEFFLVSEGQQSSIAMPKVLADKIIESVEKDIDFMPIVKAWVRFLRNPKLRGLDKEGRVEFAERFANYIDKDFINHDKAEKLMDEQGLSEEVAHKMSTVKDLSITMEGLLCTHKVVDEITTKWSLDANGNKVKVDRYAKTIDPDTGLIKTEVPATNEERLFEPCVMHDRGDAFFCEGANGYKDAAHLIKVGCIVRLPGWEYVNTNDHVSCVEGLHVGGLTYVRGYQRQGSETLDVFVDPMHIVAIADGDGALRLLQYFTHSAWGGTNGSIYNSSTYAAKTDEEWAVMRKEIVESYGESVEAVQADIAEINAI